MTAPRRPALRYHGGKWMLAPWIISHFPPHRIYVEPYGGAASVLLQKPRAYSEVYNDLDDDVVGLFRVLRSPALACVLRKELELTPFSRTEFHASYEETDDPIERARRLVVRSFMSHGTTSQRKNRTGFRAKVYRQNGTGASDWANWPANVEALVSRMRGVTIENRPGIDVIRQQDSPDTLFYVDPPYVPETRSSIRTPSDRDRAYRHDMTEEDHRELAELLRSVEGMVVLSGYPSPLYDDELYPDWLRTETDAFADGANRRTEVLWLNPAAVEMQAQRSLFAVGAGT